MFKKVRYLIKTRVKLEDKIFNFIDLGEIEFIKCYEIQKKLREVRAENRIEDTVLFAKHPLEVSFGGKNNANLFDPNFLLEVEKKYGNKENQSVLKYLDDVGVRFSENSLGGGAMAFGPGQYSYYFILDAQKHYGEKNSYEIAPLIRPKLNSIMIQTAEKFISSKLVDETNIGKYKLEVDNVADVFVKGRDKMLKVASKGIRIGKVNGKNIIIGGFTYFVDENSTEPFKYVLPCGLSKDKTIPTSFESLSGKKINPEEMHETNLNLIKDELKYTNFKKIEDIDLYKLLE